MFIRFKVGNYLSFDTIQEFSMITGITRDKKDHIYDYENYSLLKVGAIYGANASGKSNLIRAMADSRRKILTGGGISENGYFRPGKDNDEKPTYFEFEFELSGIVYSYGFEMIISQKIVTSEWLHELSIDEDDRILFSRNGDKIVHGFYEGNDKKRMDVYTETMKKSDLALFLNEITRNKTYPLESGINVFKDVMNWFESQLIIVENAEDLKFVIENEDLDWERASEIISSFDTGVTMIDFLEDVVDLEPNLNKLFKSLKTLIAEDGGDQTGFDKLQEKIVGVDSEEQDDEISDNKFVLKTKKMEFRHGETSFGYEEESHGTQRLLELIKILVNRRRGVTYVIDEVENALHPQLTYRFIQLFIEMDREVERQLIMTTHESRLLDFNLLRRDEYWFIEKDSSGASTVYSLEDFNERTDRRLDKAYLEGRYGGVPSFNSLFPNME